MAGTAFLLAAAAAAAPTSPPGPAPSLCDAGGGWHTAWRDEFDAPLNRTIWDIPTGPGSSLGREANVTVEDTYVEDGKLVLRSRALPGGKSWTTGAAITNHRRSAGDPAHPTKPADYSKRCGYCELDIMEISPLRTHVVAAAACWPWPEGA